MVQKELQGREKEMMFFKLLKEAFKEAKRRNEELKMKQRFLSKSIDYAYLEELVEKVNENPNLRISITLKDGTLMEINTQPKKKQILVDDSENYVRVK